MSCDPIVPRARLGFIIPSSNRMVEPQMARFCPSGVVPHFMRLRMTNRYKRPLPELLPTILEAAAHLMDSKCDIIVFQCTGTSMSGGVDMDTHVVSEIAKATGCPAISTASAVQAAFAALNARRLVFVSETKQEGHDKKLKFLKEAGYEIVGDKAASLSGSDEYCVTPRAFWYDMAMSLRNDVADAYFISCANISSIDVIADLERDLGKPVVTSNQAALWCALRTLGLSDVIPNLGTLCRRGLALV
ncbi:MAG TPA: aspartate/glutamate racemase family protein [Micropepsaceae bacterium]|nr:aspartate/glutamate racemase family protein [Micropepsaceae bacterium]